MTETDSMVVRVAKAMAKRYDPTVTVFDAGTFIPLARAAIEVMKEPTDLMGNGLPADYRPGSHSATQIWKAMIVKALEE